MAHPNYFDGDLYTLNGQGYPPDGGTMLMGYYGGAAYALACNSQRQLQVAVTGAGAGGTSSVDEAAFAAGISAGTPLMAYDPTSGELLIVETSPGTRILASQTTVTPPTSNAASVPAQQTVGSSSGAVLAANGARKACGVKNTGPVTVYLGLGRTPTTTAYHVALQTSGISDDGFGGYWDGTVSGVLWTGAVNAITAAGGGKVQTVELT